MTERYHHLWFVAGDVTCKAAPWSGNDIDMYDVDQEDCRIITRSSVIMENEMERDRRSCLRW